MSPTAPSETPTLPQPFCIDDTVLKSPAIGLNSASSRLKPVSVPTIESILLMMKPQSFFSPSM